MRSWRPSQDARCGFDHGEGRSDNARCPEYSAVRNRMCDDCASDLRTVGLAVRAGTLAQMRALSAQNGLEGSGLPASSERLQRSISAAAVFVRFSYGGFDVICEQREKWLILAEREGFEPSKGF